ncbi:hypothetical protein [Spirobacillus cienkowskii]|uniref:hypothetical protein n=1 Tax=Spirobacillus cienkowskii TaxID=495820 RepID=UPI0030D3B960
MSLGVDLENLYYRSKSRIKDFGEVFTPEKYVEDMLNLLSKDTNDLWFDEETVFFEPCCGHGNIVISIYKRRLTAIYKKALFQGICDAAFYSVANSINTLWAIDIDYKNIENCRSRVLSVILDFLKTQLKVNNDFDLLARKKDFFAHILSAIKWHISENETLSALSNPQDAKANANLTKAGAKWFVQNGHHQLNFNLTWAAFFHSCQVNKTIPLEYQRSLRFIEAIFSAKIRGFEDFEFAKSVIEMTKTQQPVRKLSETLPAGA